MKRTPLLFCLLLAALLSACGLANPGMVRGSGNVVTETRPVTTFSQIQNDTSIDVVFTQGEPVSFVLEGEDNILPMIEVKVQGSKLIITTTPNASFSTRKPVTARLTAPTLSGIEINGSGSFSSEALQSSMLSLSVPGSGSLSVKDLQGSILNSVLSGSGSIKLAGKLESQKVSVSGSGQYDCPNLQSSLADVDVSGSGNATVWATSGMAASVSGSGGVKYYGVENSNTNISGSGTVRRLGDQP